MTDLPRDARPVGVGSWTHAVGLPLLGNSNVAAVARAQVLTPEGAEQVLAGWDLKETRGKLDELLVAAVSRANDDHFRFDIRELHEQTGMSFQRWPMERPEWRLDGSTSTRKLTLVLVLESSPEAPVTIEFPALDRRETVATGALMMFPFYLEFRPIADSEAVVVVSYACGPAFR